MLLWLVIAYLIVSVGVGLYGATKVHNAKDYITAGRIQAQLESGAKIQDMIVSRRKEMEEAAEKQDYVEAGRLQAIVRHLESK